MVASAGGYGFRVAESELVANTRKGKQVLNVSGTDEAKICVPADGDLIAVVGTNRKMIIFHATQLPEMTRGKGVACSATRTASFPTRGSSRRRRG